MLPSKASAFIDFIIGKHFQKGTESYRRARVFASNVTAITVITFLFRVLTWFSPAYQNVSYLPVIVLCLTILVLLHKTGNLSLCVNITALGSLLVLLKPILNTGGVASQFFIWMVLPPLGAITTGSLRQGIFWSVVTLGFLVLVFYLDDTELTAFYTHADKLNILINHIVLSAIILSAIITYEVLSIKQQQTIERQVSDLTKKQEALTQRNVELERFAHVASHDLRTPLRNIISFSDLLERRTKAMNDPDLLEFAGHIRTYGYHMQSIVDNIMAYAVIGQAEKAALLGEVDLEAVKATVQQSLLDLMEQRNAQCISEGRLPVVRGNKTQFIQLFQNLVENALTYNDAERPEIRIGCRTQPDGTTCAYVRDNGIGIEPEYRQKVFDMFKRLHSLDKYPGTGLGLAICKKIVGQYGGEIWVEPSPSGGTTVCFSLPPLVDDGKK